MVPNLIIMLTHNDVTVPNAKELFLQCSDLPIDSWGFKDVGLPKNEMVDLVQTMQEFGKKTYLEVVSLTEDKCLLGAQIAVECNFDYLTGTVYYDSVHSYLEKNNKAYFPFCGRIEGHPSILRGTIDEIVGDARRLESKGVQGIDLLAYRHESAPEELIRQIVTQLNIPIVVAGSISNYDRIDLMKEIGPYGFTIGSALFERRFAKSDSFREEIIAALGRLNEV